jgi:hypothetical protein
MKTFLGIVLLLIIAYLPATVSFGGARQAEAAPAGGTSVYLPLIIGRAGDAERRPSSLQLIHLAQEAGTISYETALLYKVQAIAGDPALPAQYRGDDKERDGTAVMDEVVEKFDSLSPALQTQLQPYLLPPGDPNSWFAQNERSAEGELSAAALTWETINTANGKVKIWYHPEYGDGGRAARIAQELNNRIWPEITTLMSRPPLPDCGPTCPGGGGDNRIDIYLVNSGMNYVKAFKCCAGSSGYLVLQRTATFGVLAQGFMRLNQYAFSFWSYNEYEWIRAATATWAIDFVYPKFNQDPDYPRNHEEHDAAPGFLKAPALPLETVNYAHEYGAYLFPYFINDPSVVPDIFHDAHFQDSLLVVNSQVFEGFRNVWPQFALENWNEAPVDFYKRHDELRHGVRAEFDGELSAPDEHALSTAVPHLAALYYRFDILDEARYVTFFNTLAGGYETAHVWAIPSIDGQVQEPQDWTQFSQKSFCRDNPGENLTSLVLIFSNSEYENREHVLEADDAILRGSPACAGGTLTGNITYNQTSEYSFDNGSHGSAERTITFNVRMRWNEETEDFEDDGSTYTVSGTNSEVRHTVPPSDMSQEIEWDEEGNGDFQDEESRNNIGAWFGVSETRRVSFSATVTYTRTGQITHRPSGQVTPIEGEDVAGLGCGDGSNGLLYGTPTEEGGNTFDMSCTSEYTGGKTTVSGTLTFTP